MSNNSGSSNNTVASPPPKPLVIWDGECAFCERWMKRVKRKTKDAVDYTPYQEAASNFPEVPVKNFEESMHLIDTDGRVYRGAESAFRSLAYAPGNRGRMLSLYKKSVLFASCAECLYRFVANNRRFFSRFS